jgi:iron complex transport system ATP-binding protein
MANCPLSNGQIQRKKHWRQPAIIRSMPAALPIPGIHLHTHPEAAHLHSQELLTTLSSSFFGGGFRRVRHILNAQVAEDYGSDNPAADLRAIAARCGVTDAFVGLLTAVPLRDARMVCAEEAGLRVALLLTAGVGNATSAGISQPFACGPGTINTIVLLDARLTRGAMVNAVLTLTEAKTAVLQEMGVRTPDGALATGTSTDTVTVAMTGRGPAHPYAGPATLPGWLIARTLRQALKEALLAAA